MTATRRIPWSTELSVLRGLGPERAAQLQRLGLRTVGELLLQAPRRYEDRRQPRSVASLVRGEPAVVRGRIVACGVKRWRRGARSMFELILDDGAHRLHCRWWNQPFREQMFTRGQQLLVYGRVSGLRPPTMEHPETEVLESSVEDLVHVGRVVPVYPLTEGLPQRWIRSLIWRVLEEEAIEVPEPLGATAALVPLPADLPISRWEALKRLHFPSMIEDAEGGRRRLALEELVELQREVAQRRARLRARATGRACSGNNHLVRPFLARLGYQLTSAQTRVLREIRQDLRSGHPMRRLLQGDVGCGKTVVAASAALMTLESGRDVVLMAPTEILAEQHYRSFVHWFQSLGVPVRLHTGSRRGLDDSPGDGSLASSELHSAPSVTVGTHALLGDGTPLGDPGLVIIDEQHRFGVAQREALVRRGTCPHLLVMTATPIPRTLGLTLYGDLDLSIIDEMPAGRGRIRTFVRDAKQLPRIWEFVRTQLAAGRQAYVVCPRIESEGGEDVRAARREHRELELLFHPHPVGLLHGRLPAEKREQVLDGFRERELAVLVATTVVEVGMDVPNATVMVVQQADAYGLAQLHQLRGRIGRGPHESYCILVADRGTAEARRRLRVLAETQDGFKVAEEDLKLRGPGDFLGHDQSGMPPFRFVDLLNDLALVQLARVWVTLESSLTGTKEMLLGAANKGCRLAP